MSEQPTQVLLIEDNPGDADLVRLRLVEGGTPVEVSCVRRLSDGLASLLKQPPALVLLDLDLPDSHGSETFRRILEGAPNIPVVILSGQEDEALAIKAVHQGVQDYLVKGDITSKQLERAMRYAVERQAMLRSLEISRKQQLEFKNQFLSHVSHELRTPLTCIHQFVSLMADGLAGPVSPQQHDHLHIVLKSVNQLHAMIRDLLEATRAETGKLRIEPRCVSLSDLVHQAVAMMQPGAREKGVHLAMHLDDHVPLAHADPDRILEILVNLIDNGIKFTPRDGSLTVKTCLVEVDPGFVYIEVTDTGCGIQPESLPLIFERLYQDPNAVDGNRSGLGLGLFIAKELVNQHGGRIWVTSQAGQGTTFSFTMPLYSLAKLLFPVITHNGRLRDALVLMRVDLTPSSRLARGGWKETCHQSLELLRRCVYVDKDVVFPAMGTSGGEETFFVVASTDMANINVMMTRVREQLDTLPRLKANGIVRLTAKPVPLPAADAGVPLKESVKQVADRINEMVMLDFGCNQHPTQ